MTRVSEDSSNAVPDAHMRSGLTGSEELLIDLTLMPGEDNRLDASMS